jgi:hypothetical protein
MPRNSFYSGDEGTVVGEGAYSGNAGTAVAIDTSASEAAASATAASTSAAAASTSATAASTSATAAEASKNSIIDLLSVSRDEDEILTVDSSGNMVWESAPDQLILNGGYF